MKSNCLTSPTRRISTFSVSSFPTGTSSKVGFGTSNIKLSYSSLRGASSFSSGVICSFISLTLFILACFSSPVILDISEDNVFLSVFKLSKFWFNALILTSNSSNLSISTLNSLSFAAFFTMSAFSLIYLISSITYASFSMCKLYYTAYLFSSIT